MKWFTRSHAGPYARNTRLKGGKELKVNGIPLMGSPFPTHNDKSVSARVTSWFIDLLEETLPSWSQSSSGISLIRDTHNITRRMWYSFVPLYVHSRSHFKAAHGGPKWFASTQPCTMKQHWVMSCNSAKRRLFFLQTLPLQLSYSTKHSKAIYCTAI